MTNSISNLNLNLASDNASGVSHRVMRAILEANQGSVVGYGADPYTEAATMAVQKAFETDCAVYPVATGTGSNALGLAVACPPYGIIYCHQGAHIYNTETGAPELFTNSAKLFPVPGERGRLDPVALATAIDKSGLGNPHKMQASVLSLTQATEAGTVYALDEIKTLCNIAHARGLKVHMDGARFANALAALDISPADMSWRAGVDILSFGCTKNGTLSAEAVILFDPELTETFEFLRKRGGQLFSKMRFMSVQLPSYLAKDEEERDWIADAAHANAMAARLASGLATLPDVEMVHPTDINIVFARLPAAMVEGLEKEGAVFQKSATDDRDIWQIRMVTSFDTHADTIDRILEIAGEHVIQR